MRRRCRRRRRRAGRRSRSCGRGPVEVGRRRAGARGGRGRGCLRTGAGGGWGGRGGRGGGGGGGGAVLPSYGAGGRMERSGMYGGSREGGRDGVGGQQRERAVRLTADEPTNTLIAVGEPRALSQLA